MKVIVVGLAVTTTGATFYTKTGDTVTRNADDPRLAEFISKVVEALKTKSEVEVDLTSYETFGLLETKSNGLVRFFRVAKSAIKSIFGAGETYGKVETSGSVTYAKPGDAPQPGTDKITDEVLAKLTAAAKTNSDKPAPKADTTVVAVVDKTPIIGAEKLEKQVNHAVKTKNTVGITKFFERLATVAASRKHTAQELLHFLEKMDMPMADDGSILAYKSLKTTDEPGIFVDNYSSRLRQGLGTKVQMDAELVDDNRRVLCSNGLHIARRKYLTSYGNDGHNAICLVKINPEDVISVPMAEQDKMRVAAYHIVAVLSDKSKAALKANVSITATDTEASELLGRVIAGNHVLVRNVTTQHKAGVTDQMVPVKGDLPLLVQPVIESKPATSIEDQVDTSKTMKEAKVDPASLNKAIAKKDAKKALVQKPKAKASKSKPVDKPIQKVQKPVQPKAAKPKVSEASQKTQPQEKVSSPVATIAGKESTAMRLYNALMANKSPENLKALSDFKAKAKKGWPAMGYTPEQVKNILATYAKP